MASRARAEPPHLRLVTPEPQPAPRPRAPALDDAQLVAALIAGDASAAGAFYDRARGGFEAIFVRPDGLLTEGSFNNLFVEREGKLLTPPLTRGLLPGILRAELLEAGRAIEADVTANDLAGGFLLGNALRGLVRARS